MLLKPEEVARELRMSVYTVKDWLRDGKIKGIKVGSRGDWRIEESEVDRIKLEGE